MEGAIAGRKAIAISFPFFHGWGRWTEEEVSAAVRVAGSVSARLWREWDAQAGPSLFNVNVPISVSETEHEVLFTSVDTYAQYEGLYGKKPAVVSAILLHKSNQLLITRDLQTGTNTCMHICTANELS